MDYSAASPLEVTFTSGIAMQGDTSCAQLSIIDDTAFEGPHSFSVEVSIVENESDGTDPLLTIGTMSSASFSIVDNDGNTNDFSCRIRCFRTCYVNYILGSYGGIYDIGFPPTNFMVRATHTLYNIERTR